MRDRAERRAGDPAPRRGRAQRKAGPLRPGGDRHYDAISAWIKATRGSDPDASLLYLAIMLEGGEDPRFIARRMVILASEDIGNADPRALPVAVAAAHAVEHVGMPECALNLSQAASLPRARAEVERRQALIGGARSWVRDHGAPEVPALPARGRAPRRGGRGPRRGLRLPHEAQRGSPSRS